MLRRANAPSLVRRVGGMLFRVGMAKSKTDRSKCLCGCGQRTKGGTFRPGHDARLRGKLLRREIRGTRAQRDWLRKAHG